MPLDQPVHFFFFLNKKPYLCLQTLLCGTLGITFLCNALRGMGLVQRDSDYHCRKTFALFFMNVQQRLPSISHLIHSLNFY